MNKRKNYLVAIAIFAMILFIGYAIWIIARPVPIEIQGEVEATQIKVASKLTGRIDSLLVHKGDDVTSGMLLFTIISPELDARYLQASAVRKAAGFQKERRIMVRRRKISRQLSIHGRQPWHHQNLHQKHFSV